VERASNGAVLRLSCGGVKKKGKRLLTARFHEEYKEKERISEVLSILIPLLSERWGGAAFHPGSP